MNKQQEHYLKTMHAALKLHRPCAKLADEVRAILKTLFESGVRCPNDFQFQYTGCVDIRWYDGKGDHFGDCSRWCSLHANGGDSWGVSAKVPKIKEDAFNDRRANESRAVDLAREDAVTFAVLFVGMVDAEPVSERS